MGQRRQGEKSSTEGGVGRAWQTFGSGSVFASNKYAGCERTSEFGCFSIRAIHDAGQQLPLISLLPAAKLVARGRPRRRSQFFSHTHDERFKMWTRAFPAERKIGLVRLKFKSCYWIISHHGKLLNPFLFSFFQKKQAGIKKIVDGKNTFFSSMESRVFFIRYGRISTY